MANASAQVVSYEMQQTSFLAAAPGSVVIDFDSFPNGTILNGVTIGIAGGGLVMQSSTSPLVVVNAAQTMTPGSEFLFTPSPQTNTLIATTGVRVLSPGGAILGPGPNAAIENDSVEFVCTPPVRAFGFDHLSQSADGQSSTLVQVFSPGGALLWEAGVPISNVGGSGGPGCADFWGLVSSQANIARVLVIESDADRARPDCNIGYDTLRVWTGEGSACAGDFTGDSFVDDSDFVVFASCYEAFTDPCGDLTGDGFTDDSDFVIFASSYEMFTCP